MMSRNYQTFMLADEPKIAGVPMTTALPVFLLTLVGLCIGYVYQLFIIGAVLSLLMYYKFGGLPIRILLSMVYWSLPRRITSALFRALPNSAHRLYIR